MVTSTPRVSIIVCTRNRAAKLPATIESVFAATSRLPEGTVELVIVDNGSTDDTPRVARRLAGVAPIPVQVVTERRRGVCRAKNRGIRIARGDILVFTDDDCVLSEAYCEDLLRHYDGEAEPVVRGGRVELGTSSDLPFTIKTEDTTSTLDATMYPGGFIHGCNLAVPRSVFEQVGLFDDTFGPGSVFEAAEDTDLVYRIFKARIRVDYVPDMVVYHFHGRSQMSQLAQLNWAYQVGNGALHAKHGLLDPLLSRHLYYNTRNALLELFGGRKFDETIGMSHGALVIPQVVGILRYLARQRLFPARRREGRAG